MCVSMFARRKQSMSKIEGGRVAFMALGACCPLQLLALLSKTFLYLDRVNKFNELFRESGTAIFSRFFFTIPP